MKLIFATQNPNKAKEIEQLLPNGFEVVSLKELNFFEDIPETEPTLQGNAQLKARFVYEKFGINCFADDTGLEIMTLNNEPGVYSARYAGEERSDANNKAKVLKNLSTKNDRSAQFRTVICLILEGKEYHFEGKVVGQIAHAEKGRNGFGYDGLFIPENGGLTFAEMSNSDKNAISHRGRAFQKMVDFIASKSKL